MTNPQENAVELRGGFERLWEDRVGLVNLAKSTRAALVLENGLNDDRCGLEEKLLDIASAVNETFSGMLAERERVHQHHPWRFGILLVWLCDPVAELSGNTITRFQIMQRAGYWLQRQFDEWTDEATGVQRKTWQGWMHAVRTYLLSDEGKRVLDGLEMEPDDFVERVPMGKAQRAVAKVATGNLEKHQAEALTDPIVTEAKMRRVLAMTADEYQELVAEEETAWVNQTGPRHWLEHDRMSGVVKVKSVTEHGEYKEGLVARMPHPSTPLVEALQQAMVEAAYNWLRENQPMGADGIPVAVEVTHEEEMEEAHEEKETLQPAIGGVADESQRA